MHAGWLLSGSTERRKGDWKREQSISGSCGDTQQRNYIDTFVDILSSCTNGISLQISLRMWTFTGDCAGHGS